MNRKVNQQEQNVIIVLVTFLFAFIAGFLASKSYEENKSLDSETILNQTKDMFKEEGPIEGSWIEVTPVPYKKHAFKTEAYFGGISRKENGTIVQYEFIADAYTGSILDLYQI